MLLQDHPRVCGEKQIHHTFRLLPSGSPPRVRGKVKCRPRSREAAGITPSYAGKRWIMMKPEWRCRDHPRVCGEKHSLIPPLLGFGGSPPRVRGKVGQICSFDAGIGITPACAGKSTISFLAHTAEKDHPRVCGEKDYYSLSGQRLLGSPPRVRGKGKIHHSLQLVGGITPACAGKRLKRSRSTVPHAAIVPLFPSVCNKPAGSDGSPAGHDAPPFLPLENAAPASPAYNLRFL